MSIILKSAKMAVKPEGSADYTTLDVIADQTSDQYLTQIVQAGTNQISAIQTKGAETLSSIPNDYTDLQNDVTSLKSALTYNEECDRLGLIPYACNGSNTNVLTVAQNGNEITINGTSAATSAQAATKILMCDHLYSWNATSTPSSEAVYPIQLMGGHTYMLSIQIVSGTRDAGDGAGYIRARLCSSDNNNLCEATVFIEDNESETTYTPTEDGTVQVRALVCRLMTCTNLVVRVELSDITLQRELSEKQEDIEKSTGVKFATFQPGGIATGSVGSILDPTPDTSTATLRQFRCTIIPVVPGQRIDFLIDTGSSSYRNWAFTDSEYKILFRSTANGSGAHTLEAIAGSAYLIINSSSDAYYEQAIWAVSFPVDDLPWRGLYVSLLGDSISALAGYIPSGNQSYYPTTASNVENPEEMWWYQVIVGLGGTPLIMDAWSGSCVTRGLRSSDEGETEIKTPMVDVSRCENLHTYIQTEQTDADALRVVETVTGDETDAVIALATVQAARQSPFLTAYTPAIGDYVKRIDPDIIIIAGGTNDYSYISDPLQIGSYDGHAGSATLSIQDGAQVKGNFTNPASDDALESTFREAYATLLCRLMMTYRYALPVCCSCFFTKRDYISGFLPMRNTDSGLTGQDFNDAIRTMADLYACSFVDIFSNGFSRYNYYDAFAQDRNTSTTHPNILGHQIIAENALSKFKDTCAGFVAWRRSLKS